MPEITTIQAASANLRAGDPTQADPRGHTVIARNDILTSPPKREDITLTSSIADFFNAWARP